MTATDTGKVLRLAADGVACEIAPWLGGSILRLAVNGLDLLRPASEGVDDIHDVACFPMVPFANRIGQGRLSFGGITAMLDVGGPCAPHALHGHGWRAGWQIAEADHRHVVLVLDHTGQGWPWPYRARQTIALIADGIAIEIAVENLDPVNSMPAGVGVHPYFARSPQSRIVARAAMMWHNDATGLARELVTDVRLAHGEPVAIAALAPIDNWFAAEHGAATVSDTERVVRVSGSPATGFHLYAPDGGDFFCVEPVSHAPNAFGRDEIGAGDIVPAGESRSWRFAITGGKAAGTEQ